jgi:hypothetical protein
MDGLRLESAVQPDGSCESDSGDEEPERDPHGRIMTPRSEEGHGRATKAAENSRTDEPGEAAEIAV